MLWSLLSIYMSKTNKKFIIDSLIIKILPLSKEYNDKINYRKPKNKCRRNVKMRDFTIRRHLFYKHSTKLE